MASSVPTITFGPNGPVAPSTQAILAGVQADIDAAFGGGLNPALTTPQGQLATSETALVAQAYQAFINLANQFDPAYAYGRYQDALARLYDLTRNPSQPTVVQALCTGGEGVVIPVGALALAQDGNQYVCTESGTIPVSGSITLTFACAVAGPIACPAGSLNQIYLAIPGWDSVTNVADGVEGNDVESRSAFEARREATLASNALSTIQAILGAVFRVSNVIDVYVTENDENSPQTIGGVSLAAHSVYVAVVGGASADIAQAIFDKKPPGCAMNGNTTVVVQDTSPQYTPPYPSYNITFQIPSNLVIFFDVNIANTSLVPADAAAQIQNAIIAAFTGADGSVRQGIGTKVYASRFYAAVINLGSWVQLISLTIGSINVPACSFTGSITANVLTVSAVASGAIAIGDVLTDATGHINPGCTVLSGSGATWTVSTTPNVASESMTAVNPNALNVAVNINQEPVTSAPVIAVTLT